jgi:hypothetical protein
MDEAVGHLERSEVIEGTIDAGLRTIETLQGMRERIGGALAEGGMRQPEAQAIALAVEALCTALDMPKKKEVFLAMEGFADKTSRIGTTKLAMESISDRAKEIGAQILKALQAALEYARKYFAALFSATVGLKKKAEQISAAAKKADSGVSKDLSVSGDFMRYLTVDGKYQTGQALVAAYKKHATSPIIKEDRMALIRNASAGLEKALAEKDVAQANEAAYKVLDNILEGSKQEIGAQADIYEEALVFGGVSFYQELRGGHTTVRLAPSSDAKDVSGLKEAPALDAKVVEELADLVAEHMKTYDDFGKDVITLSNEFNAIVNRVKAAIAGNGSVTADIYSTIQSVNQLTVTASKLLRGYDVKVSSAVLDYAVKSLKAIPKAEKAPEAATA